jgi:hypothetical protein
MPWGDLFLVKSYPKAYMHRTVKILDPLIHPRPRRPLEGEGIEELTSGENWN